MTVNSAASKQKLTSKGKGDQPVARRSTTGGKYCEGY